MVVTGPGPQQVGDRLFAHVPLLPATALALPLRPPRAPDHPDAEVLRVGAIGHAERGLGSIDLMLAGDAAHLVGRFGEAEQTRGADGV